MPIIASMKLACQLPLAGVPWMRSGSVTAYIMAFSASVSACVQPLPAVCRSSSAVLMNFAPAHAACSASLPPPFVPLSYFFSPAEYRPIVRRDAAARETSPTPRANRRACVYALSRSFCCEEQPMSGLS